MKIEVAKEFSRHPFGRDEEDGHFNGERFCREFLVPRFEQAQKNGERLDVDFAHLRGLGGTFLNSAFGGLAQAMRDKGYDVNEDNLHLYASSGYYDPYILKAWFDINVTLGKANEEDIYFS